MKKFWFKLNSDVMRFYQGKYTMLTEASVRNKKIGSVAVNSEYPEYLVDKPKISFLVITLSFTE